MQRLLDNPSAPAHDGMIDKFIGDAVMAVWGAPLPDVNRARKACATALEMKRVVAQDGGPLNARIGLRYWQVRSVRLVTATAGSHYGSNGYQTTNGDEHYLNGV